MDITEFFQQSAGKWFSQRTNHELAGNQSGSGKSDIRIELLAKDDPAVVQLCEQTHFDPALALCGARVSWDGMMTGEQEKQKGSTVLVPIADSETPHQGKLLRDLGYKKQAAVAGRYVMGNDDVLTLITEYQTGDETLISEERLWFASPNLRLRTTLLKGLQGFSLASFCSEIRMGIAPPG